MLIRRFLSLLFVGGLASAAWAQDNAGCDKFKWSVARERAWFAAGAKPGAFGGVLKISGLPKAGLYEITLSDEAWVDVVQNGASVKSSDFSGQKNCPGVRKSVRFPLAAGSATVQISNAASAAIQLAIAPAQ